MYHSQKADLELFQRKLLFYLIASSSKLVTKLFFHLSISAYERFPFNNLCYNVSNVPFAEAFLFR